MRVALFARYSSKLQSELSLEAQLHEMETFVAKHADWQVTHRFCLPETRSADIERSPEFTEMLRLAKAKAFNVLLVHKLDRFGRNRDASVIHKSMLRKLGIQVRSVCENLGDGIMDRAFEGMLEIWAEFYASNLGQETRKGHRQLTRRGFFTGGKVPFGYRAETVLEGKQEHTRLVPCPRDGPVMVEVFRLFAAGQKTVRIQDRIHTMTGAKWSAPTLYGRIKNPLYTGVLRYGMTTLPQGRPRQVGEAVTEGEVAALVEKELWERANAMLASRGRARGERAVKIEDYMLSGLCKCEACGAAVVGGREGGGRPKYSCSNRRGGKCSYSAVSAPKLEAIVLTALRDYLLKLDPEGLTQAYRKTLAPIREEALAREKMLRRRLKEVRDKISNLLAALESGIIFSDMQQRIQELKREEGELAEWIATCQLEADQVIATNSGIVAEFLKDALEHLDEGADPADAKLFLQHVVELKLNLKEKRGELAVQLPIVPPVAPHQFEVRDGLKSLRSARTIRVPSTRTIKLLVPLRWAA